MDIPSPLYGRGDPIAWHATPQHGGGNGIVVEVLADGGEIRYRVHQTIDGKATNRELEVPEAIAYPTRSLKDTRPQPEVHRTRPR